MRSIDPPVRTACEPEPTPANPGPSLNEVTMQKFLAATPIIDWKHPDVLALAHSLGGDDGLLAVAAR